MFYICDNKFNKKWAIKIILQALSLFQKQKAWEDYIWTIISCKYYELELNNHNWIRVLVNNIKGIRTKLIQEKLVEEQFKPTKYPTSIECSYDTAPQFVDIDIENGYMTLEF